MDAPAPEADTRLTYDDLLEFPDDGRRHELIDGEHIVTPTPVTRHQRIVTRLARMIGNFLEDHPEHGEVFAASVDIVLSRHDAVVPDVVLIAGDQAEILGDKNVQGAPALMVEVISPGSRKRDAQTKRRLFEKRGVREYWLIDPELDLVQIYRRGGDGGFARAIELTAEDGGVLTTPLLPGCSVDLRTLFR